MSNWPERGEFEAALAAVTKPSQSRIGAVASLAVRHVRQYKMVVHLIVKYARKATERRAMPALYIIDAVCKASAERFAAKDPYPARFEPKIVETFEHLINLVDSDRYDSVDKLLSLWVTRNRFSQETMSALQDLFQDAAGRPASTYFHCIFTAICSCNYICCHSLTDSPHAFLLYFSSFSSSSFFFFFPSCIYV
jgi:CID domain